jgi:hypothetical protein
VLSRTLRRPLTTFDTVIAETPARSATAWMLTACPVRLDSLAIYAPLAHPVHEPKLDSYRDPSSLAINFVERLNDW